MPLIERLRALNHCKNDLDCSALGYVCGVGCHVPVSVTLGNDDDPISLAGEIRFNDPCDAEGEARKCGRFYGIACEQGRCVMRSNPPPSDICWANHTPPPSPECRLHPSEQCYPKVAPTDCRTVLREHAAFIDCREFCDGRNPWGARVSGCADYADGSASCYVIDYVRCDTCLASRKGLFFPGRDGGVGEVVGGDAK